MTSIHDDEPGSRSDTVRAAAACPLPPEWERLARRADTLEMVIAAGRVGYCRLRAADLALEANSQFKSEWGWPPDEVLSWDDVQSRVHPDDRDRLSRAVRQALEGGARVDLTVRAQPPARGPGETRWLALQGCVVRDGDDGQSAVMLLTSRNVTSDHRASEGALELLSVISHELRSPLNAILGWTRILALKCANDPQVAAITPRIEQSAKAQLKAVNDLLDVGRLSAGKLEVQPRPIRLAHVARLAIDLARPAASARGIEIVTRFDPGAGELNADPERLQQVIGNLLSNAVKFTGSGGRIIVGLREEGGFTELTIEDTGQGIEPELLPHVFDGLRQAESPGMRRACGFGLGLTLVREIVALHGGSVSAHSAGPGTGTSFSIRLPTAGVPVELEQHVDGAGREPPDGRQTLAGLSILVVDDEPDARSVVAEMLRLEGAAVAVTDSASSALRRMQEEGAHFDILVTDIGMPMEDGYSLVRKLRSSQAGRRVLAIAVTGYASRSDVAAAMDAGFDLHVPKPVDFDTFVPLVRRLASWRDPAGSDS